MKLQINLTLLCLIVGGRIANFGSKPYYYIFKYYKRMT